MGSATGGRIEQRLLLRTERPLTRADQTHHLERTVTDSPPSPASAPGADLDGPRIRRDDHTRIRPPSTTSV